MILIFVINYNNFTEYFEKYTVVTDSKMSFYALKLFELLTVMEFLESGAYPNVDILFRSRFPLARLHATLLRP
jgi:hypothetical protein